MYFSKNLEKDNLEKALIFDLLIIWLVYKGINEKTN